MTVRTRKQAWTYGGVFLIALSTLMVEILLTRITSVTAWYHLAFFVISLAMLGMTAGAVTVYLRPAWFTPERVPTALARFGLAFALTVPVCVGIALAIPLLSVTDLMSFLSILAVAGALAIPFALGGVALTLALTRAGLPPGIVYGVDLCGAATGCALIIPLLDRLDAPSAAIASAAIAALGAVAWARAAGQRGWLAAICALGLAAAGIANSKVSPPPLRPVWVKGMQENLNRYEYLRWNTYSRVTVEHPVIAAPPFWAKGRNTPPAAFTPREQRFLRIDGAAGTMMMKYGGSVHQHAYLAWDIVAFAHHIRPHGGAAVIGVGGGRDVLEAARVGHDPVVGIELNDLIVDLHRKQFPVFSGLSALPQVELIGDEARSRLARETRSFQVIAMSLIDTWASTGAGAYSLSENSLYTREAFDLFLDRLDPNGIFTVSRWYVMESPGETARMLALAMETLWQRGAKNPRDHIALIQNEIVAALLVSPSPFSPADVDLIQREAIRVGFNMLVTPRNLPAHPWLRELATQPNREAMWDWARKQKLDMTPPTDDRPFFFNMLRPKDWLQDPSTVSRMDLSFLGNLQATQTLLYATLASLLLTLATVFVPMVMRRRDLKGLPRVDGTAALGYFALIGFGFMLVEIGLLSRLSVYLGHPILALAVLLGAIIFFSGIGALLSERVPIERRMVARLYPLMPALLVLISGLAGPRLLSATASATTPGRIMASLALVAPPALGLGLCFPLGLRLVDRMERALGREPALGPWLWGVNGAAGVCASGLALAISMVWGIPVTLLTGASCYLALTLATNRLSRAEPPSA